LFLLSPQILKKFPCWLQPLIFTSARASTPNIGLEALGWRLKLFHNALNPPPQVVERLLHQSHVVGVGLLH